MVGPGEVDQELEGETAEECGKYGKVIKCVIFEVSGFLLHDVLVTATSCAIQSCSSVKVF